jgi:hypothetical protein
MNTNSKWNAFKEAPWPLHGEGGYINKKSPAQAGLFSENSGSDFLGRHDYDHHSRNVKILFLSPLFQPQPVPLETVRRLSRRPYPSRQGLRIGIKTRKDRKLNEWGQI